MIYENEIVVTGSSTFQQVIPEVYTYDSLPWKDIPTISAFLKDDDLQQITVSSGNMGFVRTFTKRHKKCILTTPPDQQ